MLRWDNAAQIERLEKTDAQGPIRNGLATAAAHPGGQVAGREPKRSKLTPQFESGIIYPAAARLPRPRFRCAGPPVLLRGLD